MKSLKGRLRRSFKAVYPWLNSSFEVWLLASNVAYLFDRTPFYRPWLAWIGVDLRRLGVEDFVSYSPPLSSRIIANLVRIQRQASLGASKKSTPKQNNGVLSIIRQ